MRSIMALFLALIVTNFAMAHGSHGGGGDEGGLSVGLGFGAHIHADEGEFIPNAEVSLSYSESFFDDKLDFEFGASYLPALIPGKFVELEDDLEDFEEFEEAHAGEYQHVICLNAGLTFNIILDYFTTLSFSLEIDHDFYLVPREDGANNQEGVLTPGIKLNWGLNFGDIYLQCGVPLQYISYRPEEFGVGIDGTIGWESKFGLGINCTAHFLISPESGFDGVDAVISYVLPIKQFSLYANCTFEGIGTDEVHIAPGIGVRFNF
ncbi:hypothetical protein R84B8_01047 [Treponema sp. R8-4-B8]